MKEAKHNRSHTVYFHLCEIYSTSKSVDTESRFVVARGSGERGMGSDCLVGMRSPLEVIKCFEFNLNSLLFFLLMLVLLTFRPLDSQCIFKHLPQRTDPEVYHFNDSVCKVYTVCSHLFLVAPSELIYLLCLSLYRVLFFCYTGESWSLMMLALKYLVGKWGAWSRMGVGHKWCKPERYLGPDCVPWYLLFHARMSRAVGHWRLLERRLILSLCFKR